MPFEKYTSFRAIDLPDRQWPNKTLTQSPRWCSVDLRDGNQALIDPMSVDEKMRLWDLLLEIGFAEIEVVFLRHLSQTLISFVVSLRKTGFRTMYTFRFFVRPAKN